MGVAPQHVRDGTLYDVGHLRHRMSVAMDKEMALATATPRCPRVRSTGVAKVLVVGDAAADCHPVPEAGALGYLARPTLESVRFPRWAPRAMRPFDRQLAKAVGLKPTGALKTTKLEQLSFIAVDRHIRMHLHKLSYTHTDV